MLDNASTAETTRAHSCLWPCLQLATWQSLLQYTTDKHLPASAHAQARRSKCMAVSVCCWPRVWWVSCTPPAAGHLRCKAQSTHREQCIMDSPSRPQ